MSLTYGICSDAHLHNWSAFSRVDEKGLNSRLGHILDQIQRAAEDTCKAGGRTLYITGDLFHVRGSVSPTVLNPTIDLFTRLTTSLGLKVRVLAGNHDLESRDSSALGNACESLRTISGIEVISTPALFEDEKVVMVPWYDRLDDVRHHIDTCLADVSRRGEIPDTWTLMLHAPVNGVLAGLPDNGFSAAELARYGFKRVFVGHYHNHKRFEGEVYSVGATTHQTWNDVGSRAGYLLVGEAEVDFRNSSAPRFIDLDNHWNEAEARTQCAGNYVRARLGEATEDDISQLRNQLKDWGVLGSLVQAIPLPRSATTQRRSHVSNAPTLRESIRGWVQENSTFGDPLITLCNDILNEAEAIDP
ncbi:exonuclease [Pseudomonas asuensis]|uniref:Exonuclease n=1 Tax=Pseudomonas asuensis TaxID=1825787 RepID=A0ABQ2GW95_9PSED|nr:metallophosphoesterase [Pseudomonas asuensis]GGM16845.1 exonuclease [Pseudomonas asuensis]